MPLRKRQKIQEMLLSLIPASGCQSNPRQGLLYGYRLCLAWGGHSERDCHGRAVLARSRAARWSQRSDFSRWQDRLRQQPQVSTWGMATKYSLSCRHLSISRATSCFLVEHEPRPIEVGGDEVVVGKHVARVAV